jgi:hypothetical protein
MDQFALATIAARLDGEQLSPLGDSLDLRYVAPAWINCAQLSALPMESQLGEAPLSVNMNF